MKIKWNLPLLPWLILGLGGLGAGLWQLMLSLCLDEKGLLAQWNLPQILVWLVTLAVIGLLLPLGKLTQSQQYSDLFPQSPVAGAGAFLAAVGTAVLLAQELDTAYDRLGTIWLISGILAILCLLVLGLCRIRAWKPHFVFDAVLCLYFALFLAHHYRLWSGEPQTGYYLWQLLAAACLALTAYHRAAFTVGMGKRRSLLAVSLAGSFCCVMATPCGGIYYLLMGLWAAGSVSTLEPEPGKEASEL